MSQSPVDQSSLGTLTRYRQGWKALNRLLHEERSFSGNEKNCAFLSMRNGKFAAISSVSGLDFNDDSRAVALCDWNFDGRVDLWTSARTTPRLRLLKNQTEGGGQFVAVQLRGNGRTTNRDAIGARVEIVTDAEGKSVQTLHAGDGFLTQSSRWIHFGLGGFKQISDVRVRWPGGKTESFGSADGGKFYVLTQGEGAVEWRPPNSRSPLVPKTQAAASSSQVARVVPPYRLPLPAIEFDSPDSQTKSLVYKRPTLVCIWSASCNNCIRELTEWSKRKADFDQHGLDVVAVCADLNSLPEQLAERTKMLEGIAFPFKSVSPKERSLQHVDLFQRALMDLWQTMPVPCSFLVDEFGQVVTIYKGPVETEQVWRDLSLIDADSETIREAALPFAGIWGSNAAQADPLRISSQMVDHTQVEGAISYLQLYLETAKKSGRNVSATQQADVLYVQSILLESSGKTTEALAALEASRAFNPNDFRIRTELAKSYLKRRNFASAEQELAAAVEINPRDTKVRRDLAVSMLQQGKLKLAVSQFQVVIAQQPNDALAFFHMATAQRKSGQWKAATNSYQRAVDLRPDLLLAANNLAWILATHPDDALRDGDRAKKVATVMCERTKYRQPAFIDTLAAAHAEVGEYEKAVELIDRIVALFEAAGKPVDNAVQARRQLYLKKLPYREEV